MLKRTFILLLLSTFVFTTTEFCQLLKLPMLFQHFQEHKLEDNNLSFFAFLKMHYFNGNPKDADFEKDMKLPFKTTCTEHHVSIYELTEHTILDNIVFGKSKFLPNFKKKCLFSEQHSPLSTYLNCIWQPPQLI